MAFDEGYVLFEDLRGIRLAPSLLVQIFQQGYERTWGHGIVFAGWFTIFAKFGIP